MISPLRVTVLSAFYLLLNSVGHTQVINFNVPGNFAGQTFNGVTTVNYRGQGALVDPGHNYWNAVKQNGTTSAGFLSDGVTSSPITLTDRSPGSYTHKQGTLGTPAGLEAPLLLVNNGTTVTQTISNVPPGTYNLYLYGKNDNDGDGDRGTTFTVSSGSTSYGTQSTVNGITTTFTLGNDYVKYSNIVVGISGVITFTYAANTAATAHHDPQTEGDFNGLQLIPTAADTNPPPVIGWRVVVPTLNTNEIVVTEITPQDFGALGDGVTDDSAAFQAAINAAYHSGGSGGGVVYVPKGNYAFSNNITIMTGVTLHGDWQDWTKGTNGLVGTTFKVYQGAGQVNGTPFITMQGSASLWGVNIWYPNQNPNSLTPTAYPFTIKPNSDSVVKNVVLVNSYQGIQITGDTKWILSTLIGTPLYLGLWVDGCPDVCQTEDVRFSPDVWVASKLPGAPTTTSAPYVTWMRNNGIGFQLLRLDGVMNMDTFISGYKIGLDFEQSTNGAASACFYNGWVTNCAIALSAQSAQQSAILQFARFTLDGDVAVSHTNTATDVELQFNLCQIIGRSGVAVNANGNSWNTAMDFQNSTINGTMQLSGPGVFNLVNCSLNASTQCVLSASATRAGFTGCTFSPSQNIVNNGNGANLVIDSRPAISNAMPVVYWTNVLNDYISRRPAKLDLFVATDFGAQGNNSADDTAAIQAALNAAGTNGGGIVYVPAGKYRLTSSLDVPGGVELRGAYELRHRTWPGGDGHAKGTILEPFGGQGTTNGPPTIILEANAGMRGITMSYESQTLYCLPFPPAIQGRGGNVYAIGIQSPNAYWFVDFNTYTCTNHFLDMMDGSALWIGFAVGNGSSGSIVDCHNNQTYWTDNYDSASDLVNLAQSDTNGGPFHDHFVLSNCQYYAFGNCTEQVIKTFSYQQNIYMHCFSQNGVGANVTGISPMSDASYQSFVFEGAGTSTVNVVNPDWMVIINTGVSGLTNQMAIVSKSDYQGKVRIFNSPLHAGSNLGYSINGGDIGLEMVHGWQYSNPNITVNGGAFHLVNAGFFGSNPKITFGAGAGIAGLTNEFIGCYCQNGFTYTNLNSANPVSVWNDYALFGFNIIGGPPNLALNRPVTVSSVADGTQGSNAVDGNLGTRWSSAYSDPQSISVDLGTNYNITAVELVWENAYGKAYQIQVSSNALNWTTIYSTTTGAGGTEYLSGLSGQGRYIRLNGTQRALTQYGYSLWEFEVFGNLVPPPVSTTPTQIALSYNSGLMQFSWPADHTGWRLEMQTNAIGSGLGTNWVTVPASVLTNQLSIPVDSTNGSVFFRLVYP